MHLKTDSFVERGNFRLQRVQPENGDGETSISEQARVRQLAVAAPVRVVSTERGSS